MVLHPHQTRAYSLPREVGTVNDNQWEALIEEVDITLSAMDAAKIDTGAVVDLVEEAHRMRTKLSIKMPEPGSAPMAFEWSPPMFEE
jgi:hypothetical protein